MKVSHRRIRQGFHEEAEEGERRPKVESPFAPLGVGVVVEENFRSGNAKILQGAMAYFPQVTIEGVPAIEE